MAKIVQVLTRPSEDYDLGTAEAQVRDLDATVLNILIIVFLLNVHPT